MRSIIFKLTGRLTVGRKLALIYFLDLTAVIFVSGILINEKFIAIDFAKKEILGNQYISVVKAALLTIAPLGDEARPATDVTRVQDHGTLARAIIEADAEFGSGLGTSQLSTQFADALRLSDTLQRRYSPATWPETSDEFAIGRALLTRIGNQSNLILDPDLDSYYTMSLIVLRFPELLEVLASTSRLAQQISTTPADRRQNLQTQFLILEGRIDAIVKGIRSDYSEAFAASTPALKSNLVKSRDTLLDALERFRFMSQTVAGLAPALPGKTEFAVIEAHAITALRNAWTDAAVEMDRLLRIRIDDAFTRMWMHLGTAMLLLFVILGLVFFVARQIAIPIRNLARVAENVRHSGDYTLRAAWDSEDEIGRLVTGFNSMLSQLDRQRIKQQELVAQARAAEAQRELVDAVPNAVIVTAIPHHEVLHANPAAQPWLRGQEKDPWLSGMEPEARVRFFQGLSDVGTVDEFEVRWTGGKTPMWALVSARRMEYQGVPAVLTTFTPIGQIKYMESRLELWAKVFEASSEGIVVMDASGKMITVNHAFCRSTSYERSELVGRHPRILVSERNDGDVMGTLRHTATTKGTWQGEIWIKCKTGKSYPAWLVVNSVRDSQGQITHFIAISLDITQQKANEQRIHYLAHHDVLTGLPNRFLCEERLQLCMQQARRTGAKVAVLFVDLDRFKNINDSLGHHIGDGLLCSVATRLANAVREGDTVSRMGGDEFVIILNNVENVQEIGKIVEQRLIPSIRLAHNIEATELYVSCSVGIAVFPDDGEKIDQLMRNADSAMYEAKKLGRNNAQFFTRQLNDRVVRHLHLESELRHAVERGELVLHYQPRVSSSSGRIAGLECLVRWNHPIEGLLLPGQFISVAEESGLIVPIGAWIIQEACKQHLLWREQGLGEIPISINLSAVQLKDGSLVWTLKDILGRYAISPSNIELELTESILMDNVPVTIRTLDEIKSLGLLLSVDDFGTGYSSLDYLCRFPIDKLKIDRSFIRNIDSAPHNLPVTKAIIGLGHTLGLEVVAEGVEREADVALLKNAGCDELQGFHIGRPMPAQLLAEWLRTNGQEQFA